MKSENVVLICVLIFVSLVVAGLSLQSCRTVQMKEKSALEEKKDVNFEAATEASVFQHIVDKYLSKAALNQKKFKPIFDENGNVVDTYLEEETTVDIAQASTSESISNEDKAEEISLKGNSEVKKKEEIEESKHPPWWEYSLIGFVLLFIVFLIKCFK